MKKLFKNITIGQLLELCKQHHYMIVRDQNGREYGLNGRLYPIAQRRNTHDLKTETSIVSFRACGMHEYISYKIPYV